MLNSRRLQSILSALVLLLLPAIALAEVSGKRHPRTGEVKVIYLAGVRGNGSAIVWSQVRAGVSQREILNPRGDSLGDLAPVIRSEPLSGLPWVVWPGRVTNIHQIAVSHWEGTGWSPRQYVVPSPAPYYHDDINPDLAFDLNGQPFVVWERSGSIGTIQFSTLSNGTWTPPITLSPEGIDSRFPTITVAGTAAKVRFLTPGGWVTTDYETDSMLSAATGNLMDTPIPPGYIGGDVGPGGGGSRDGDKDRSKLN